MHVKIDFVKEKVISGSDPPGPFTSSHTNGLGCNGFNELCNDMNCIWMGSNGLY